MKPPPLPFSRWPLPAHLACALALLLVLLMSSFWGLTRLQGRVAQADQDAARAQAQLVQSKGAAVPVPRPNFTSTLPHPAVADEVVRDMARFAQGRGVQVGTVSVQGHTRSDRDLARVQLTATVQGDYKNNKAWLAELLARYAALGVGSLSMLATDPEGARQTLQVTLQLFVKD